MGDTAIGRAPKNGLCLCDALMAQSLRKYFMPDAQTSVEIHTKTSRF
ncbi:hypothetical protein ATPR_3061 [Acetobacter tropicalis NBRC 101654]|uniref:Uncharacterized protein n=1 Tax=Acetobacter tropicalis NBRC 101654 TaxID=749388 RepID=F7VI62_9PROT|nr:hypothetical protein ATPR_3061 [Acetobacter tropicalis NBRC 101654]